MGSGPGRGWRGSPGPVTPSPAGSPSSWTLDCLQHRSRLSLMSTQREGKRMEAAALTSIRGQVSLPRCTVTKASTNALRPGAAVSLPCEARMKLTAMESRPWGRPAATRPEGGRRREGPPPKAGPALPHLTSGFPAAEGCGATP